MDKLKLLRSLAGLMNPLIIIELYTKDKFHT